MARLFWPVALALLVLGCARESPPDNSLATYFDHTGREDVLAGGVRMIPVLTPQGTFRVWTKRIGNNPRVKVLVLHGGPGATHEYLEAFDSWFAGAGIEYYDYDQLGASGKILNWDRSADLKSIAVPTLVIGARHDSMDPKHMEWMTGQFPNGTWLYCPEGSHLAFYDDQATYFDGLIKFLREVDAENRAAGSGQDAQFVERAVQIRRVAINAIRARRE